jgi:hypothetical protein
VAELHDLCSSEMGTACSTNGNKRIAYCILAGNSKGKRQLDRLRCIWVDNFKIKIIEIV